MKFYEQQKKTNFNVGLFVIVAAVILIAGYLWLINYLEEGKMTKLKLAFPEVNNLDVGDGVLLMGVNRGKVKSISISGDRVLVEIAVKLDKPLSADTEFRVGSTSVMGSTRIIIIPGSSQELLPEDQVIQGYSSAGFNAMFNEAASILQDIEVFLNALNSTDNIFAKYSQVADSIQFAVSNFNEILSNNDQGMTETVENLQKITNDISRLVEENQAGISATITNAENLVTDFDATNEDIQKLTQETQNLIQKLQTEDNTLGKLSSDDELYRLLLNSVSSLDSLLTDIKENPRKYFTVKVF